MLPVFSRRLSALFLGVFCLGALPPTTSAQTLSSANPIPTLIDEPNLPTNNWTFADLREKA